MDAFSLLLVSWSVLIYSGFSIASETPFFGEGECEEDDLDGIEIIPNGKIWKRRCQNCTCNNGNVDCSGPPCENPYQLRHETTCRKWDSDECCCEVEGCEVAGKMIPLNSWYQDPENEYLHCLCTFGRTINCFIRPLE